MGGAESRWELHRGMAQGVGRGDFRHQLQSCGDWAESGTSICRVPAARGNGALHSGALGEFRSEGTDLGYAGVQTREHPCDFVAWTVDGRECAAHSSFVADADDFAEDYGGRDRSAG